MKYTHRRAYTMMRSIILIASALILTSCIDIEITLRVRNNQKITLDLVYHIDHDLAKLGSYEDKRIKSLPIEQFDFQRITANHSGVEMQRYRQRNKREYRKVNVRLRFDSAEAFNRFFTNGSGNQLQSQITHNKNVGQLIFPLASANADLKETKIESSQQQFAREFFTENQITLKVIAPQRINTVNAGKARGKRATVMYPLSDLVATDRDIIWQVDW